MMTAAILALTMLCTLNTVLIMATTRDWRQGKEDPMTEPDEDARWRRRCRHVYALLRKAEITDREARLNVFRWIIHDPTISSTNDLSLRDLNVIVDVLEQWKHHGELLTQAHEHSQPMQGRHCE